MSDGVFPDRLTQLRNRWESDPSSRVFLQLAEEYRHQGRVKEALDVLERGLKEHPGYLSALVAKGRCLIELGEPEPAREVLERVVKQDATQMVANKLLVRAYIETGDPERARERLDLYTLLNDSDPEIEELRRRLRAMEQPPRAETAPAVSTPRQSAGDDIFDLGRPPAPARDVFDPAPAPVAAPPARQDDPFSELFTPPAPAAAPAAALVTASIPTVSLAEEAGGEDVLFPGLFSQESRQRYLSALSAEGLFAFEAPAPEAAAAPPAPAPPLAPAARVIEDQPFDLGAPPPSPAIPGIPSMSAFPEFEAPLPTEQVFSPGWTPAPEPVPAVFELEPVPPSAAPPEPEPLWEPEPLPEPLEAVPAPPAEEQPVWSPDAPTMVWNREEELVASELAAPAPAEPVATATLGEIYLRQGHPGEAKRIFEEVLRREPGNAAALEGLQKVEARRREKPPLEVRDLMAGYEPGPEGGEAEVRARKAYLLTNYLKRLRSGG